MTYFSLFEPRKDRPLIISEPTCMECGMHRGCLHPKLNYTGNGKLNTLIIAEANGPTEDERGIQLCGKVGQFFRDKIKEKKLELDRHFFKMNATNCWPRDKEGKTREPNEREINCCRPLVDHTIHTLQPKYIMVMGGVAANSFWKPHFGKTLISQWRGLCIPDYKYNTFILPLFHPSYPQRSEKDANLQACYDRDLDRALFIIQSGISLPEEPEENLELLYDYEEITYLLNDILRSLPEFLFYDLETTGLKPQAPGHKIVSMSLCFHPEQAFSFPVAWRDFFSRQQIEVIVSKIKAILEHKAIKKISHNMIFENMWSTEIWKANIKSWYRCTMNMAHIIDNRSSITSLDIQSYINFGIYPYGKDIKPFLRAQGGNGFNQIEKLPLPKLLKYGCKDSLYGYRLFEKQEKILKDNPQFHKAYELFHEGALELSRTQMNGICVNEDYFQEENKKIELEEINLIKQILTSNEAKKFKEKTGNELNITSNPQIATLLYDVLGKEAKTTSKGNYTVDAATLEKVEVPIIKDLLRLRHLEKIRSTYMAQFTREVVNGRMHPFFSLNIPVSFRSSSRNPNFQNIPERKEDAKRICKTGLTASKERKLLAWDYSGVEVCTAACVTMDKSLIRYVTDDSTDMHRDNAMDLFFLPQSEVDKMIRFWAKNGWTFAQFYGDYYVQCAKNIWAEIPGLKTVSGVPLKEHLRMNGIKNLDEFTEHCKEVERKMWNVRFKEYNQWKKDICKQYQKNGYVETDLGFRFQGYMTRNQVCNYPIQGPAFHLLLWTLIELGKVAREEQWKTFSVGQIHDSGMNDLYPNEEEHVIETIKYIGTIKIREKFPWIVVPLKIDFEISEIDGNWYDMKEMKGVA